MRGPELTKLKAFLGLDDSELARMRRNANGTFAWNVALEHSDLANWMLISQQFVQVGEDRQFSTGLWKNDAGVVVLTEINTHQDVAAAIDALILKLATAQLGSLVRDDPKDWIGLRFRSQRGMTVICLAANMVINLIQVEGAEVSLIALSDELVESILGDEALQEEDTRSENLHAKVGEISLLQIAIASVSEGRGSGEKDDLGSILEPPPETRAGWPITRLDRPTRVIVKSNDAEVLWQDGELRRIANKPGYAEVAVTVKRPGAEHRKRVRLSVSVNNDLGKV